MIHEIKILLACGNGASSGYLATQVRKAAKKKGINATVSAIPISNLASVIHGYDIALIGPHHAFDMDFVNSVCAKANKKAALIPKKVYAELDGAALVELCLEILEKED